MNIKDLLKVFKESNVLQKIEFADPKILLLVGQGLGIVPNQNHYLKSGLLPEIQLSRKSVNQITKEFKTLLNNIGVTQNCILNSFDKNNLSFKCYDNAGDELGMLELHCDNYLKKNVTLTLTYKDTITAENLPQDDVTIDDLGISILYSQK